MKILFKVFFVANNYLETTKFVIFICEDMLIKEINNFESKE